MNPEYSEYDAIHEAHAIALTPTRGEHEVNEPDPYCWGDDPCVCVQLKAARENERNKCWDAVVVIQSESFQEQRWIVKTKALEAIAQLDTLHK